MIFQSSHSLNIVSLSQAKIAWLISFFAKAYNEKELSHDFVRAAAR